MKKITSVLCLIFISSTLVKAQPAALEKYIQNYSAVMGSDSLRIDFGSDEIQQNDLIFFGFIHGAALPQLLDFELLKYFVQNGTQYYMPEVTYSMAFFLNLYLEKGDIKLLNFVTYFYKQRVPQDASIQFHEKWKRIYILNESLPADQKIKIIGVDKPLYDKRLALTHLAYLAPTVSTGNALVDSLKYYRHLEIDHRLIWSGKPAMEKAIATNKSTFEFVYPEDSKYNFSFRFFRACENNKTEILKMFGENEQYASRILADRSPGRETYIFKGFQQYVMPLIEGGDKVYANYGYAHIQQARIAGNCYLACLIKEAYPAIKLTSIQGLLAKSNVLNERKLCKTKDYITEHNMTFQKAEYCGYKTSKSYDGHSFFEQVNGIKPLMRQAGKNEILMLNLKRPNTPFDRNLYFAENKRGSKHWKVDKNLTTLDYFQYVIFMKKSQNNVPISLSD